MQTKPAPRPQRDPALLAPAPPTPPPPVCHAPPPPAPVLLAPAPATSTCLVCYERLPAEAVEPESSVCTLCDVETQLQAGMPLYLAYDLLSELRDMDGFVPGTNWLTRLDDLLARVHE